jgi:tetratricopeptide (TPR) repeat protein
VPLVRHAAALALLLTGCGAATTSDSPPTLVSPQAYEHYLRARLAGERGESADAAAHLRIAIQAAPDERELRAALIDALLADGNLPEAAGEARAFVERWPDDAEGWEAQGRVAALRRQPRQATVAYRRAVELDPVDDNRWLLLAAAYRVTGELELARRTYQSITERFPAQAEGHYRLGRIELEHGRLPAAERSLTRAIGLDGDRVDARILLAETHRQAGRPDLATASLREAFVRSDRDPEVGERLFHTLLDAGDRAGAVALLAGLEREVIEPPLLLQVGELYLVLHRADDALRIAGRLVAEQPAVQATRLLRARALDLKGDRVTALGECLAVPEDDDSFVASRALAAVLTDRLGQPQRGLELVDRGLVVQPGSSTLVAMRATLLDHLGRRDEARRELDKALARTPDDEELLYARANLEQRAGDPDRAVAVMAAHLETSRDSVLALNFIAYSWAERGIRLVDAERMLRRALALRPHDGFVLDSLGVLFVRSGRLDDARLTLERADRLAPFEPEIMLHLGEVYLAIGDAARARATFHQALALDPDRDVKGKLEERLRVSAARLTPAEPR